MESAIGSVLFAIFVNSAQGNPETMAGIIGLLNTSPDNAVTELGLVRLLIKFLKYGFLTDSYQVIIFPKFHRTFVTTNAIGLLLQYVLDEPPSGLGLRRAQWQANSANEASIRAATRLGFTLEGIIRWQRVLPRDKKGKGNAEIVNELKERDEAKRAPGRHSAMLAICWDDWLTKREEVVKMMERR